jgi:hypothetical protein
VEKVDGHRDPSGSTTFHVVSIQSEKEWAKLQRARKQ